MGKNEERYQKNKEKYSELRKHNARNYYWKKKGKQDYYYIQRDLELLQKKLQQIKKIADRLKLNVEVSADSSHR